MRLKYEPALDGMRGISAIAVLLLHTHVPFCSHGGYGVNVFFVLSGFLITKILLDQSTIDIPDYLGRRFRRLIPALVVMASTVTLLIGWLIPRTDPSKFSQLFAALTYSMDIVMWRGSLILPLSHTWTLALEMQFYLIWPLVVARLKGRRSVPYMLVACWLLLGAIHKAPVQGILDFNPIPFVGPILLGAAVAFHGKSLAPQAQWLGAALLIAGFGFSSHLVEIGTAVLLASLTSTSKISAALSWSPIVFLGTISYGIYLWHFPISYALEVTPWFVNLPVTLASSIAIAAASYFTVERLFRQPSISRATPTVSAAA